MRWFCADGAVLPPKAFACADHGGGIQHGELSDEAQALRDRGYAVANVLAATDPTRFTGEHPDLGLLAQILLERFLVDWDDGWIFHRARRIPGMLQAEDEEEAARRLVRTLLNDPHWRAPERFLLLREVARLLPVSGDVRQAARVRERALRLAERDAGFVPLRAKLHSLPDPRDAERVREHARSRAASGLAAEYEALARAIEELYAPVSVVAPLETLAARIARPPLPPAGPAPGDGDDVPVAPPEPPIDRVAILRERTSTLASADGPEARMRATAGVLEALRDVLPEIERPRDALEALRLSLAVESRFYAAGTALLEAAPEATRRERLAWLRASAEALYGTGLFGQRHLDAVRASLDELAVPGPLPLRVYREALGLLARGPEWGHRRLAFHFAPALERWTDLDREVLLYPQDRLRESPLLFYGRVVDGLVRDANALAGVSHELFGRTVGSGLRALNPGVARGVLRSGEGVPGETLRPDGIVLLPDTVADLAPVAGILTRGEGSSLSHVQLLARNLGIPNVVVTDAVLPLILERLGAPVVLAVSPGGVVQLDLDGPQWDEVFARPAGDDEASERIRPDLEKLDLFATDPIPLAELGTRDSGRVSGPKGANLGELRRTFGKAVPDGFVIPFGAFRRLLDRPLEPGGPSVWAWMNERYAALAALEDDARRERETRAMLERLRAWILAAPFDPDLEAVLRSRLREQFGPDGTYGVFVRSDTNVEDLAGFTGAGLNLTVPNVVGEDAILEAVRRVQASPFTERAFRWRQSRMEEPAYVFPAVLVQRAFPAEKSGVMVTADLETGDRDWISVATSEGPGGAVEGQAAESLRVNLRTGEVRFLAQATAPERTVLRADGGVARRPASGAERLLTKEDLIALVQLAWQVQGFPALRDASGRLLPADVEFAFADDALALLQIRPFVESRAARSHALLRRLDAGLRVRGDRVVDLDGTPLVPDAPFFAPAPAAPEGADDAEPEARPVGADDAEPEARPIGADDAEPAPVPPGADDAEPAPAVGADGAGSEATP